MTFAKEKAQNRCRIFFIFLTSVLVMLFATKSSPLYPFNDWVDANAYFTVGKSILKGYVPYRDLFDHKGPVLFFIHTLAATVSFDSFLGVFIIEVIACFAFLLLAYKTLLLYTDENSICVIPLVAASVYSLESMCHGDSVEELCLPIFMYTLYIGLKSIRENRVPNFKEGLIIGVTSALIFWMKYTLLGIYLGWIIVPFIMSIKNKQFPKFLKLLLSIFIGLLAVSAVVILYFAAHHAVSDLFKVYFYDNLFLYNTSVKLNPVYAAYMNVYKGWQYVSKYDSAVLITNFIGIIYLFVFQRKRLAEPICALLCIISTFCLIFAGGQRFLYYSFPLSTFNVFIGCCVYDLGYKLLKKTVHFIPKNIHIIFNSVILLTSVLLVYIFSSNSYMLFEKKENLPQYEAKEYIENCGIDNPTVLNYMDYDRGFYTVLGIVPDNKYFFMPNIEVPEINAEQDYLLNNKETDFVFTSLKTYIEGYTLIDCYAHYYSAEDMEYSYLYQKIR